MTAFLAVALMLPGTNISHKPVEPVKKPTELDLLVKSRSIDKLRAKFLQAPDDDVRDDVRAAIISVVREVHRECSKVHQEKTMSQPLEWPEYEHRGYIDLSRGERKRFNTLYAKHPPKDLFRPEMDNVFTQLEFQLVVVAGEIDTSMVVTGCIILCDSTSWNSFVNNSVLIASSDVKVTPNVGTLTISNGRVDLAGYQDPVYSRGDIFIVANKLPAKEYAERYNLTPYYGEGKTADTGLTFFKLTDLGIRCKLAADKAIVVESVKAGSPAEAGKMKAGDVLRLVNLRRAKALDKVEELFRYAMMESPKAKVTVLRGKESLDLEILFP